MKNRNIAPDEVFYSEGFLTDGATRVEAPRYGYTQNHLPETDKTARNIPACFDLIETKK
jgi:hypothetical protein